MGQRCLEQHGEVENFEVKGVLGLLYFCFCQVSVKIEMESLCRLVAGFGAVAESGCLFPEHPAVTSCIPIPHMPNET